MLGALVGAAIGAAASPPPCSNCLDFSQGAAALGSGLVGGVIGALVGVAIGSVRATPGFQWKYLLDRNQWASKWRRHALVAAVCVSRPWPPLPNWRAGRSGICLGRSIPAHVVRVVSPGARARAATGRIVSTNPDTLLFRWDKRSAPTAIATPSIIRLDVARGTHQQVERLAGRMTLGAMTGAAIGAVTYRPSCNGFCFDLARVSSRGWRFVGGAVRSDRRCIGCSRQSDTWVPVKMPGR